MDEQLDEDSKTRGGKDNEDGIRVVFAERGFLNTLEHETPPVGKTLLPDRQTGVLARNGKCPGPPVVTLAIVRSIREGLLYKNLALPRLASPASPPPNPGTGA